MVEPFLLRRPDGSLGFLWNLEGNVGAGQPNFMEDVQFVQFGYFFVSKSPATPPSLRAAAAEVALGAAFSGTEDDPVIKTIRAHESLRGGPQDGRISKFPNETGTYNFGGHEKSYILLSLLNTISDAMPGDYPRIYKHPLCPPILKAAVQKKSPR
jgi:hypothetical protein